MLKIDFFHIIIGSIDTIMECLAKTLWMKALGDVGNDPKEMTLRKIEAIVLECVEKDQLPTDEQNCNFEIMDRIFNDVNFCLMVNSTKLMFEDNKILKKAVKKLIKKRKNNRGVVRGHDGTLLVQISHTDRPANYGNYNSGTISPNAHLVQINSSNQSRGVIHTFEGRDGSIIQTVNNVNTNGGTYSIIGKQVIHM